MDAAKLCCSNNEYCIRYIKVTTTDPILNHVTNIDTLYEVEQMVNTVPT